MKPEWFPKFFSKSEKEFLGHFCKAINLVMNIPAKYVLEVEH
jgi:hypothetical protein